MKLEQFKSVWVKSGQVKSSQDLSSQIKSGQVNSSWDRSSQVMTGQVKLGKVKSEMDLQFFGPEML